MQRYFPSAIAATIVLLTGYLHGRMTNRWSESTAVHEAAAKLQNVPATIGDWQTSAEMEIPKRAVKIAEFDGYISRTYVHGPTNASVNLLIGCGKKGPISVHPPDVCFPGAGFYPVKPKEKFAVPGTNAEASENFWVGDFEKSTPTGENYLRVFWSWNGMGRWRAADVPRVTFARAPFLYKMYVTRSANRNNNRLDDDPCVEFLTALIPVLNQVLFDLPPDRISPTPSL